MALYTTEEIITGIRLQNPDILRYVYKNFFPEIRNFVIKNGGSDDDAKDCFQESVVVVFRKAKEGNMIINKTFSQYLLGVCRYIFYQQKTKNKLVRDDLEQHTVVERIEETESEEIRKHGEYKLYQYHFKQLGKDCQDILTMMLHKIPVKEIAEKLGTTEGYIHSRKYKCRERLISNIKNDPNFGRKYED